MKLNFYSGFPSEIECCVLVLVIEAANLQFLWKNFHLETFQLSKVWMGYSPLDITLFHPLG